MKKSSRYFSVDFDRCDVTQNIPIIFSCICCSTAVAVLIVLIITLYIEWPEIAGLKKYKHICIYVR